MNAGTLAPEVGHWPPKFAGILFSALGQIQGHIVQHLLVTWGRLKSCFLCRPWRDAKYPKPALSDTGFGPDSAPLHGTALFCCRVLKFFPFLTLCMQKILKKPFSCRTVQRWKRYAKKQVKPALDRAC